MALFKFTKGIIDGTPIDIYNNGEMVRDFTYVTDLVNGIYLLSKKIPSESDFINSKHVNDSISNVAPYRVVNIGNSEKVPLLKFIEEIESNLNKKAIRNYMPMQKGDVPATFADTSLVESIIILLNEYLNIFLISISFSLLAIQLNISRSEFNPKARNIITHGTSLK